MAFIEPFQVIIIIFALFAWSRVYLAFRKKNMSTTEFVFWCVVWAGIIGVAIVPGVTTKIANAVGITRGLDLFVYGSIIVLFYLVYRIYVHLEQVKMNLTKLVRKLSFYEKTTRKTRRR
ncbi:MAG: DUF2304 domain-containing protein [archaeon]